MPLASSALLPSVPGTLPATHVVSSHSFILVGTDLKHWKISIKKSCGRSIGFPDERGRGMGRVSACDAVGFRSGLVIMGFRSGLLWTSFIWASLDLFSLLFSFVLQRGTETDFFPDGRELRLTCVCPCERWHFAHGNSSESDGYN